MHAKPSKIPPRLILGVAGILLLILVLHLGGIAALRYFVERELHPALPRGTYIGEVQLNLFTGRLKVSDFQLHRDGQLRLRFGELDLKVSPWQLLTGTVHIERASLQRAYARIDRRPDGSLDLGLPPFGKDAGPPPPDRQAVDLRIDGADLGKITIEYHDGGLASAAYVEKLTVGAYSLRASRQTVPVEWVLQWDGRSLDGRLDLGLDEGTLAAGGDLRTDLLDIGRAQQLARLEPVARGEVAYQGSFRWQPPKLRLAGSLTAPSLDHAADDQAVALKGLSLPGFALELDTGGALTAGLDLEQPLAIDSLRWRAEPQAAELDGLRLGGRWQYADGGAVSGEGLDLDVGRLAWDDGQAAAIAEGARLSGSLSQRLGEGAGLPTLTARLAAGRVSYRQAAEGLDLQLDGVRLDELSLRAAEGRPGSVLAATLAVAAGKVRRDETQLDWQAMQGRLDGRLSGEPAAAPALAGDLRITGISLADPALRHGPLTLAGVAVEGLDVAEQTRFAKLRLDGIALPSGEAETVLRIAAVDLTDGSYSPDAGVAIGAIVLDAVQTGVIRNKAGQWRHVMSAVAADGDAPRRREAAGKAAPAGEGGGLPWQIGALRVTGDSRITVADALNPGMQPVRYAVEQIEVGRLASGAPDRDTPFKVSLRPDKYSEFHIDGVVRPLADPLYLKAEGHLQGFGLSTVNGIVANDLGHRFLDGQLDDDFTITIAKNRLDMENRLGLAQVAVEPIPDKEGPPLGTAIALLEDRDGNIKLEVPVSGDLNDPDFRVLGALNPIIMKAVAGTAALAIQPLGSVLLVGGLLANQALKVTFEPALFEPGSAELAPSARDYLARLGAKLGEKPKLGVRVCGLVVDAERVKDKKGAYLDQEAELLALAQERADRVRAELQRSGAGRTQLRACRPAIDPDPAARPRVDIRF